MSLRSRHRRSGALASLGEGLGDSGEEAGEVVVRDAARVPQPFEGDAACHGGEQRRQLLGRNRQILPAAEEALFDDAGDVPGAFSVLGDVVLTEVWVADRIDGEFETASEGV